MGLSKEEKELMAKLQKKAEEPDAPSGNVTFSLDLGNDSAWERAVKLGIVPGDSNGNDDDDDDKKDKPDEVPPRRGYFGT